MDAPTLRQQYDLARCYTASLYDDLSEVEAQWRPSPKSSSIAWHLGHQAAVNHFLLRNLIDAEQSPYPAFDPLFDSANPEENRGDLPALAEIISYRDAVAQRTHEYIERALAGNRPAANQLAQALGPILCSIINHEYQHDCWAREMRAMIGRDKPDVVLSDLVRQVDGFWMLGLEDG